MEKNKKEGKNNNMLPLGVMREISLRIPVNQLTHTIWKNVISDPSFAKSHYESSLAPTHRCIFIPQYTNDHVSIDLDALSQAIGTDASAATITKIPSCPPLKDKTTKVPDKNYSIILGSCRGFIALYLHPDSFVIWNPLTGTYRTISCHHIAQVTDIPAIYTFSGDILFGFGYDAIRDDYLVILFWNHKETLQGHFDFFSLRSNSWSSFEDAAAIPDQLLWRNKRALSLFFNGAIHWLSHAGKATCTIVVFDASQRNFSKIPVPEEAARKCGSGNLRELGGCLAFYYEKDIADGGIGTSVTIWVMREYNVHSSWTSYEIPSSLFEPFWLSENGDFIGFDNFPGMATYNVNGELLHRFDRSLHRYSYTPCAVYTESLLSLPNDGSEEKQGNSSGVEES